MALQFLEDSGDSIAAEKKEEMIGIAQRVEAFRVLVL